MNKKYLPTIKNIFNKEYKMYKDGVEATIAAARELLGEGVINLNVENQLKTRAHQLLSEPAKKEVKEDTFKPSDSFKNK